MDAPRLSLLARLLIAALALAAPAVAQSPADIARVEGLMRADSYNFQTTRSPSVWVIHFPGNHLRDIKEIVTVGGGADVSLVVFVTVTEKRRMPINTDFMRTLLEQDHKLDRVKVAYDADGDLEVRIDASLRVTDAEEFRDIVDQVKNASDTIYGLIAAQLLN